MRIRNLLGISKCVEHAPKCVTIVTDWSVLRILLCIKVGAIEGINKEDNNEIKLVNNRIFQDNNANKDNVQIDNARTVQTISASH